MKYIVLGCVAVSLALTGCGKKLGERIAEKAIEAGMSKNGEHAKVDLSDGKMTIQGKDGTAVFSTGKNAQIPADFPKDVFVPDGAAVMTSITVPNGMSLVLTAKDNVESVIATYKGKMAASGWKEEMSMNQGDNAMLVYKKETRTATAILAKTDEGTQINLTVATGN